MQLRLDEWTPPPTDRHGSTYSAARDFDRLNAQQADVWSFIKDGEWHTLREISAATGHPEAVCIGKAAGLSGHGSRDRQGIRGARAVEIQGGGMKYGVILADPPWLFRTFSAKGEGKSPQRHYRCMSIDDIKALPVPGIAADDCALFLWATWPTIFQAESVINAWGFRYSGLAWEWIKQNPVTGKYSFGGGYGTRKNLEPCLLARRGSPKVKSRSIRDFIIAPRREHSRKPDEQYERIEAMYDGPYLEMFARQSWRGWDQWGDEVEKYGVVG